MSSTRHLFDSSAMTPLPPPCLDAITCTTTYLGFEPEAQSCPNVKAMVDQLVGMVRILDEEMFAQSMLRDMEYSDGHVGPSLLYKMVDDALGMVVENNLPGFAVFGKVA